MKSYILIQNDGEIESNSFELIGASTKRGEKGKIGFFGSGLKYSIAYMMRNCIDFKIFSGEKEIKFTTIPEQLKDKTFDRICIDGKPSSYTTSMGPTWTEDWFILREIYCNALDESNCQLIRETINVNPAEGKTRIYVELTPKLKAVIEDWDQYFSMDREPIFVQENVYTSFISQCEEGYINRQRVSAYHKTNGVIYRRGIQVSKRKNYLYDYGIEFADINEDRTIKNSPAMAYAFVDLMAAFPCENYIKSILRTALLDEPCAEYTSMSGYGLDCKFSDNWVGFSQENLLVVREISGKYASEISEGKKEAFLIPATFARLLKRQLPEVSILGMGKSIGEIGLSEMEKTPKMEFLLKEVLASLTQMNYAVKYDIQVCVFNRDNILGQADLDNKIIYLADHLFDKGRREIAMTIMEETEHLNSGEEDETRAFQNHIFSKWLKTMEEANGLFL